MKKGIFSGIVMFLVLFLVVATINYSRLPIQAEKTASETELIKNYNFTAQIASSFASKTLSEAIGDHIFSQGFNPTPPPCSSSIDLGQLKTKYDTYLKNIGTNLGNCKIVNPTNPTGLIDISIGYISPSDATTFYSGNFSATILLMCKSNQNPALTTIDFNKTYSFNKFAEVQWSGTTCDAIVNDTDAGNFMEYGP